eukprot:2536554-Karenia_brevis.AAC.1
MFEHKGLAWAMAAQSIVKQFRRCLGARASPQGLDHGHQVEQRAQQLALTYKENTSILESIFAVRLCSALSFISNLGRAAVTRLQDNISRAITA